MAVRAARNRRVGAASSHCKGRRTRPAPDETDLPPHLAIEFIRIDGEDIVSGWLDFVSLNFNGQGALNRLDRDDQLILLAVEEYALQALQTTAANTNPLTGL